MPYSDDPVRDFLRHDREQSQWLMKRPVCCYCRHHIQEEEMFVINDNFYHVHCAEEEFKKYTEDFIEE